MTRYRITFEDTSGHSCGGDGFEAKDDIEASRRGKRLLPAQISNYEIWRGEEATRGPLVFAEWTLTATPDGG